MRAALLVLPLLLLLVPPQAEAQGDVLGVRVIEDPAGDVMLVNPSGTPLPGSHDRNRFLDLRAVDMEEQPDGYFVHLWVVAFPPEPRVLFAEEGFYRVYFVHQDVSYEIGMQLLQGEYAWLGSDPSGSGEYDTLMQLEMSVDPAAGRLSAFVPRTLLADRDGAPPFPGRALTQFTAIGRGAGLTAEQDVAGTQTDLAVYGKDDAAAPAGFALPVQFGAGQSGDARLYSPRPFRASNGEAATFIFEVEASNYGPDERLYRLEALRVPPGWQVTFPQQQVRLGGTDSQAVPVLATVPFAHQHGRISSFVVEMRDLQDADDVGRVELGLHYTDPAQPAGHHPDLYLHSTAPAELETLLGLGLGGFGPGATMNTAIEDPADDAVDVTGSWSAIDVEANRFTWQWIVPLSPHLQMGLDVDLLRQGTISIPIGTTLPLPAARLDGAIYAARAADEVDIEGIEGILLASIPATAETDLLPAAPHTFQSTVVPSDTGDYVPYDPELNLLLVLNVSAGRPSFITGAEAPVLKPGGHLTLPLLEYADPVDDLFATAGGLELELAEGAERRAPPGGSAVMTLRAFGAAGHYQVHALGLEADWVALPSALHVGDDGVGEARLAVDVPADAPAGTVVDLVLEVTGGPDDAVRSLTRLRVTVDPAAPDEGGLAPAGDGKDAPGPVPLAALLVLLTFALLRWRKA